MPRCDQNVDVLWKRCDASEQALPSHSMKEFQPFRLDVRNQCLWKGTVRLSLMPKPFAVLAHLVEHAGRLVTQDELLAAVWPDTFVQPEVLRKHILEIRRVLDDRADQPRFVETLPKRGYTFIAPVTDIEPSPSPPARVPRAEPATIGLPGRAAAIAALHDGLARALTGARAIVFATGEAGIGKTTLVDAWLRSVARWLARDRSCAGRRWRASPARNRTIRFSMRSADRSSTGRRTPSPMPWPRYAPTWLARMPTLAASEPRTDRSRDQVGVTREGMVREICEALEVWSESHPLVIVLEDLHWADPPTLERRVGARPSAAAGAADVAHHLPARRRHRQRESAEIAQAGSAAPRPLPGDRTRAARRRRCHGDTSERNSANCLTRLPTQSIAIPMAIRSS